MRLRAADSVALRAEVLSEQFRDPVGQFLEQPEPFLAEQPAKRVADLVVVDLRSPAPGFGFEANPDVDDNLLPAGFFDLPDANVALRCEARDLKRQ